MELRLVREPSRDGATIGRLTVDGDWSCYTLEDEVRPPGVKIPGRTAIPAGRYEVRLTHSPRFGIVTPEILRVPMFTAIRVHVGNTHRDSEGCVLVGKLPGPAAVYHSKQAFVELMEILERAHRVDEEIWIEIVNAA